jgi:hypothetical protein
VIGKLVSGAAEATSGTLADIPSIARGVTGVTEDAFAAGGQAIKDGATYGDRLFNAMSYGAHSLSLPVKYGIMPAVTKAFSLGDEAVQTVGQNIELAWKGKSVVSSLYHDVKQAIG